MNGFKRIAMLCLWAMATSFKASAAFGPMKGMALVPKGEFTLPFPKDTAQARMKVEAFYLDKHQVTQTGFRAFVLANPDRARSRMKAIFADGTYLVDWKDDSTPPPRTGNTPVTHVSWFAAKAYCASLGKRLPTTAEWESAARALPPGIDSAGMDSSILEWYARPAGGRMPPMDSGSVNGNGIRDLFGLVWEWTSDFDAFGPAGSDRPGGADAAFCGAGGAGGAGTAKQVGYAANMRWALRMSLRPEYSTGSLGFRCASDTEGKGNVR